MMQQKVVIKVDIHDDIRCKKKVLKLASSIAGVESISMDTKDKKLTVIGDMDPISVVQKLRKSYGADILTVGPAKEPEKPKEQPKKPEEPKPVVQVIDNGYPMQTYYPSSNSNTYYYHPHGYRSVVEEDPNACVIC
ncbi:Heavy metal-associated isoprenylated plant protein 14 [Bienertia sinuspersici]